MIVAKEKAKELFDKFYDVIEDFDLIHESYEISERKSHSIRCALISVDEIIKQSMDNEYCERYWQEVKQEIKKI